MQESEYGIYVWEYRTHVVRQKDGYDVWQPIIQLVSLRREYGI